MKALFLMAALFGPHAHGQELPQVWRNVAATVGRPGTLNADGSFRINILRSDTAFHNQNGMAIPAEMGLATYAAFQGTEGDALMVGDVAMLRHEIDGVVDALRGGGIEVVALHNHMSAESPRLFFLHFQGRGPTDRLARAFRRAIDACGKAAPPASAARPGKPAVDWAKVEAIFGAKPSVFENGVVRFARPRSDLDVKLDGRPFLPGMGLGSWATLHRCDCGKTMAMGDTCTTRADLQAAIDALRKGGISITAIHNHILGGTSEVMFLHYEGEGDAENLARTIRACWDSLGTPRIH